MKSAKLIKSGQLFTLAAALTSGVLFAAQPCEQGKKTNNIKCPGGPYKACAGYPLATCNSTGIQEEPQDGDFGTVAATGREAQLDDRAHSPTAPCVKTYECYWSMGNCVVNHAKLTLTTFQYTYVSPCYAP